jgi:hypothetical protein
VKEAAKSDEFHRSKGCKIKARKSNHFELVPIRIFRALSWKKLFSLNAIFEAWRLEENKSLEKEEIVKMKKERLINDIKK